MKTTDELSTKKRLLSDTVGVSVYLFIAFSIGIGFVWNGSVSGKPHTAVLWAFACFMLGALIGFLFGIPKVLQGNAVTAVPLNAATPSVAPSAASAQRTPNSYDLRVNTNLEQISDWLTKIIVGLGLVELRTAPARLKRAADYIATGIGPNTQHFAAGLIVYFIILGFIGAYLITRLYITGAFSRADQNAMLQQQEDRQRVENLILPEPGQEKQVTPLTDDDKKAAKNVASKPLANLSTPTERSVWAKAQLSLGNYANAVKAYGTVISELSEDPASRFAYATALYYSGAKEMAYQQLREAYNRLTSETDKVLRRNVYRFLTYVALYLDPPKGFDDAIRFGEEYVGDSKNLVSAGVWTNLAAAYGQKMKWLLANNSTDQITLDQTKARALAVVQKTVSMGERWKRKVRELMDKDFPGKDPAENDLEVFASDAVFRAAAGLPELNG
ncbi:tetratricopeptide repeat protein [Fibrivirga algicola]|uniref:Tetratricopeptide repeat protein n=1 Tax=Fibrivirga algicola TaxID=2950420 RepID=A0ABX0QM24_9BACT|nr:hypothetical protein [Fibrivirga algicola]NID13505.1 hypothetical protein [Fibrivirga algicola]